MKIIYGIATLAIVMTIAISTMSDRPQPGKTAFGGVHTVVLTAKDMKFNMSNPTIAVAPGEIVRIVIRNEDPGMKHDLLIPQLQLRTPVLEFGDEAVLQFRVPKTGSLEYLCSFHPISMRGLLEVVDFQSVAGASP